MDLCRIDGILRDFLDLFRFFKVFWIFIGSMGFLGIFRLFFGSLKSLLDLNRIVGILRDWLGSLRDLWVSSSYVGILLGSLGYVQDLWDFFKDLFHQFQSLRSFETNQSNPLKASAILVDSSFSTTELDSSLGSFRTLKTGFSFSPFGDR